MKVLKPGMLVRVVADPENQVITAMKEVGGPFAHIEDGRIGMYLGTGSDFIFASSFEFVKVLIDDQIYSIVLDYLEAIDGNHRHQTQTRNSRWNSSKDICNGK